MNSGGIINVAAEYLGWTTDRAKNLVEATAPRLETIYDLAADTGLATHEAAKNTIDSALLK